MSRPSDHEFDTEFGGGLEAWHPDCAGLAWARLYAEAQRARAGEEAAAARLRAWEERWQSFVTGTHRAMEERAEAAEAMLRAAEGRAEKAERERDEARRRLNMASRCIHGRFLHDPDQGDPPHAGEWCACGHAECVKDRAALGEKP